MSERYCAVCGDPLPEGAAVCPWCGAPVREAWPKPEAAPTEPEAAAAAPETTAAEAEETVETPKKRRKWAAPVVIAAAVLVAGLIAWRLWPRAVVPAGRFLSMSEEEAVFFPGGMSTAMWGFGSYDQSSVYDGLSYPLLLTKDALYDLRETPGSVTAYLGDSSLDGGQLAVRLFPGDDRNGADDAWRYKTSHLLCDNGAVTLEPEWDECYLSEDGRVVCFIREIGEDREIVRRDLDTGEELTLVTGKSVGMRDVGWDGSAITYYADGKNYLWTAARLYETEHLLTAVSDRGMVFDFAYRMLDPSTKDPVYSSIYGASLRFVTAVAWLGDEELEFTELGESRNLAVDREGTQLICKNEQGWFYRDREELVELDTPEGLDILQTVFPRRGTGRAKDLREWVYGGYVNGTLHYYYIDSALKLHELAEGDGLTGGWLSAGGDRFLYGDGTTIHLIENPGGETPLEREIGKYPAESWVLVSPDTTECWSITNYLGQLRRFNGEEHGELLDLNCAKGIALNGGVWYIKRTDESNQSLWYAPWEGKPVDSGLKASDLREIGPSEGAAVYVDEEGNARGWRLFPDGSVRELEVRVHGIGTAGS